MTVPIWEVSFWWNVLANAIALSPLETTIIYILLKRLAPAAKTVETFSDEFSDEEWRMGTRWAAEYVRTRMAAEREAAEISRRTEASIGRA